MKNIELYTGTDLSLPVPVPDGTLAGDIVPLPNGLIAVCITPQATQALINLGACVGLLVGQASAYLRGKTIASRLPIDGPINQFDRVYKTAAGIYTATAAGNTLVGHSYDTLTAPGVAVVIVL